MANTDFIDDDLVKQRAAAKRIKLDPVDEPMGTVNDIQSSNEIPIRPVSDFNLTRMAKHKQEMDEQVVTAMQELERLRARQENLEKEKRDLEEIRRKQEEYERGKREMVERFNQSLLTMEKDELQASRLSELMGATRKRFKALLADIQGLNDEVWPEEQFRDELNKALLVIEDARREYNKAITRIDTLELTGKTGGVEHQPVIFEEGRFGSETEKTFAHWLKVGFAVSLPLIMVILAVTALILILHSSGRM
jgi:DNA repair exonuclease SbcCD ATPase subunit